MTLTVGSLITLIIVLFALGLLVWLAFYLLQSFPPPDPLGRLIKAVVIVVAVLIIVVILLNMAGIGTGIRISERIDTAHTVASLMLTPNK